ncbi:hypothetical protein GCM10010095_71700 [Streptomyces anthocyanicus]|uniref:Bacterial DNA polymerase III alpha subunit NTPase domain-containing protein n=1 Tax=Streptomyces violaceolatus TaxID=67378 RepID=A0ABN3TGW6_9ACTN|nr:hypothetical protein GCM10010095_71700 [Streptomyces anthocyanicus]GHC33166.1 hypothetical protein GCM10010348_70100 [Streptomyces anthocyanicus]
MDRGLSIERDVREGLLRLARELSLPLLATNDAHYVHESQADAHDNLLCIGVGKNKADEKRFRFSGSGYYLKTAAEMRALFAELPEACDNTLLIAERVGSYDEVFDNIDEMPQFPDVPDGETQESWLRKEVLMGLAMRYGDPVPAEVLERFETEMSVIGPMGFSSYFLVVADICKSGRPAQLCAPSPHIGAMPNNLPCAVFPQGVAEGGALSNRVTRYPTPSLNCGFVGGSCAPRVDSGNEAGPPRCREGDGSVLSVGGFTLPENSWRGGHAAALSARADLW